MAAKANFLAGNLPILRLNRGIFVTYLTGFCCSLFVSTFEQFPSAQSRKMVL